MDLSRPMLEQGYDFHPMRIGDDVTITTKCTILAEVGQRGFVAANSVVTDLSWYLDIPATKFSPAKATIRPTNPTTRISSIKLAPRSGIGPSLRL